MIDWLIVVCRRVSSISAIGVSDCCLTPTWREQVNFQWINTDFYSLRIDMSPHLDTLSWFPANQSLLFPLNAACLAEKQQLIPIL